MLRSRRAELVADTSIRGAAFGVALSDLVDDALVTASAFGRERISTADLARDREVALWWSADDAVLLTNRTTQGEEE